MLFKIVHKFIQLVGVHNNNRTNSFHENQVYFGILY